MGKHLGLGVMLRMLGGYEETAIAVRESIGLTITSLELTKGEWDDDVLRFTFENGSSLIVWDNGQSCCESRYMSTDDDLNYHIGATLTKIEVSDAPNEPDEYGEHEVQFLIVTTSKGVFTMANHNEHNGYYGGFSIEAVRKEADTDG